MNDDGYTSLPGGLRLEKSDALICAVGSLDELNAALGLLRVLPAGRPDAARIEAVQRDLLRIGSELATGKPAIGTEDVAGIEAELARQNAARPPLHGFVLPGTDERSARTHAARTACRRAERELVRARKSHPERIFPPSLAYLNRLSSLLFAMAKVP